MDQQPTLAPSALRYALRAIVLLGGALVWWLLFSGGPAQASDHGPSPVVEHAAHLATQPVHDLGPSTERASSTVREAPRRASGAVADATKAAPAPVRRTVQTVVAATEPVLTATAATVADTMDNSIRTTQVIVDQTVQVVLPHAIDAPSANATTPRSATTAVAPQRHQAATRHTTRMPAAGAVTAQRATAFASAAVDGSAADPVRSPRGESAPMIPVAPTAPAGGSAPAAVLAGLLLAPAILRLRRRRHDDASLPTGPAYPPGSSPG